jgi:cytochrome c peroxidase
MASAARTFTRQAIRPAARNAFAIAPRQAFRQQGGRFYSSESEAPKAAPKKSSSVVPLLAALAAAGGLGYWYLTASGAPSAASTKIVNPTKEDYQKVYNEIASRLEEKDDYDDGSFGPVLLRLAWHASGTYDKLTGTGGSNGATMRFAPESDHGANAGLIAARNFLEPIKGKHNATNTFSSSYYPS